jgi:hypothetical protein
VHGSRPSVARCDGCGRTLCLACATPVRGGALGAECLQRAIGPDAPAPEASRSGVGTPGVLTVAAFGLAVVATFLPWSRFGPGSGAFGAWSRSPRWSMAVALAASAGLLLTAARTRLPRAGMWDAILAGAGVVVAAGAVLALLAPPDFASPWIGPWVALGAGIGAVAATVGGLRARNREGVHV